MAERTTAGPRIFGLDVVRASAIILVVVSHYSVGLAWSRGLSAPPAWLTISGFYGVELFFALSGYLIGNILLKITEREFALDTLWRFFIRRWLRTLPCYWIVLLLSAALALFSQSPPINALRFATLTQNVFMAFPSGFFDVSWSLTIEEWFYVLFPIALFGLLALTPRRGAVITFILFLVLPPVGRYVAWHWFDVPWSAVIRKNVFFQLDAIAYGALAAYVIRRKMLSDRTFTISAIVGAIVIVVSWIIYADGHLSLSHAWVSNGRFISASIGCALLVVASLNLPTWRTSLTSTVEFISRHSFTIYLVHVQAHGLVGNVLSPLGLLEWTTPLALVVTTALSVILTKFVEIPIMLARPMQFATMTSGYSQATSAVHQSTK